MQILLPGHPRPNPLTDLTDDAKEWLVQQYAIARSRLEWMGRQHIPTQRIQGGRNRMWQSSEWVYPWE